MADKKQMMDIRDSKGVTTNESNEHRRNWNDQRWSQALHDGNYDLTRQHLNFEIVKGGKIQPIDKTKTIPQMMKARLDELGIRDPNEGLDVPKYRTAANIIFGGNRERMLELAFGNQDFDTLSHTKDHSHLRRMPEIEEWAKDVYDWCCRKWGEDNIMSFVAHLDEVNPHLHCVILPITPDNKLSYRKVFVGERNDKWAYRENMLALHTSLAEEVNDKYGLSRGDDIYETGARHRSTEEYKRDLARECTRMEERRAALDTSIKTANLTLAQARTKVRALTTMVENKRTALDSAQKELAKVNRSIEAGEGDMSELLKWKKDVETKIERLEAELADKEEKLRQADEQYKELFTKLNELRQQQTKLEENTRHTLRVFGKSQTDLIKAALFDDVIAGYKTSSANLKEEKDVFDDSWVQDIADDGKNLIQCAMFLMLGAIDQATTFAQSHGGGGGSSSKLPWRKRDDEDDIAWARRCAHLARAMMKPTSAKRKR